MTGILLLIGIGTALAVLAILTKTYAGRPKRAEKWEKGEIIKQLLALSEGESASAPATRGDPARKGTLRQHNSRQCHTSPTPPNGPNQTDARIDEEIRQRAYQLYQERGGVEGDPTDDWLQAKKEVLSHKAQAGRTSS